MRSRMTTMRVSAAVAAVVAGVVVLGAGGCAGKDGGPGATGEVGATGADGDKGQTGATGEAGADGDKGATGATGETGADGADGACAGRDPLAVTSVTVASGASGARAFPGQPVSVTFALAGTHPTTHYEFLGAVTAPSGLASLAPRPIEDGAPGHFTVTLEDEGDATYTVFVSDGCTVAVTTLTVSARYAHLGFVHAAPTVGTAALAPHGSSAPLVRTLATSQGPYSMSALPVFNALPSFFLLDAAEQDLDVLDVDAGAVAARTGAFTVAPGGYYFVVLHAAKEGGAAATAVATDWDPTWRAIDGFRMAVANIGWALVGLDVTSLDGLTLGDDLSLGDVTESFEEPWAVSTDDATLDAVTVLVGNAETAQAVTVPLEVGSAPGSDLVVYPGAWTLALLLPATPGVPSVVVVEGLFGHRELGLDELVQALPGTATTVVPDDAVGATFVNAYGAELSLAAGGSKDLLVSEGRDGPVTALMPGEAFPSFVTVPWSTTGFDVYPADDATSDPLGSVAGLDLLPGDRPIVVAHTSVAGELAVSAIAPSYAAAPPAGGVSLQVVNLVPEAPPFDVYTGPTEGTRFAQALEPGELSVATPAALQGAFVWLGIDGDADGRLDLEIPIDRTALVAGSHVVVLTVFDGQNGLVGLVHQARGLAPQLAPQLASLSLAALSYEVPAAVTTVAGISLPSIGGEPRRIPFTVSGAGCAIGRAELEVDLAAEDPTAFAFAVKSPEGTDYVNLPSPSGPVSYFGTLDAYTGGAADGEWSLQVVPYYDGDNGTLTFGRLRVHCQ